MEDLPENLQVIKLEPPGTPEKANIKERLNLHVKRRLQQEMPVSSPETPPYEVGTIAGNKRNKNTSTQPKETQKQRKPYQKRMDKVKTETNKCKKAEIESFDEPTEPETEIADARNVSRERCKNSDILNVVLSRKKRQLMQDPEVQLFWSKIVDALKK